MRLVQLFSYLVPITVLRCESAVSGPLDVRWEKGRMALNGPHVNYSFNRLHKVMSTALKSTDIERIEEAQILNLGMGAGSTVEIIREDLKMSHRIVSVELDPVIIGLAHSHFDIDRHADHEIIQEDAEDFMMKNIEKYDLIIVDLFIDAVVPEQFRKASFVSRIFDSLTDKGQAIFNHMNRDKGSGYREVLDPFNGEWRDVKGVPEENDVLLYSKR